MRDMIAWHGTNQSFENFDEKFLGLSHQNSASRSGFFFSLSRETAWSYADSAARKIVPNHESHEEIVADLLEKIDRASRSGNHDLSENLTLELERIETEAIYAPPSGARVLRCALSFKNPMIVDDMAYDRIYDLGAVISQAWKDGHDAVIIENIADTPCGSQELDTHIVIPCADQIEILEVILDPDFLEEDDFEPTL